MFDVLNVVHAENKRTLYSNHWLHRDNYLITRSVTLFTMAFTIYYLLFTRAITHYTI